MSRRKINWLLVLLSMVGGTVGFIVGELILAYFNDHLPHWLLMGIYFGQYALFVGLFCLFAEMISPHLNGTGWKQRYLGFSWKMLIPSTLVMLFVAGSLFQVVYGLDFGGKKPANANDIVMLLDVSDSMHETDPNHQLFKAAADVIRNMDAGKRVAIIVFNDQASVLQPLVPLANQETKDKIIQLLNEYPGPSGGTDIGAALRTAMDHMQQMQSERSMLILMSDGYSQLDLNASLQPYKLNQIAINTVGISNVEAKAIDLLKTIAKETNGSYFSAENADQLSTIFGQIYRLSQQDHHLVGPRHGLAADSGIYGGLRIAFVTILGGLIGLSLGLFFDNKYLAKSFSIGGIAAGLIAGLILEFGLGRSLLPDLLVRLLADLVLALILSVFTALVAIQERSTGSAQGSFTRGRFASGSARSDKQASSSRFDA